MNVGDMLMTNSKLATVRVIKEGSQRPNMPHFLKKQSRHLTHGKHLTARTPNAIFLAIRFATDELETLWIISPFSVVLAAVGLIESLMTLT